MPKDILDIATDGLEIEVIDGPDGAPDDGEELIIVCVPPNADSPFKDNVVTKCRLCEAPIMHRPNIPKRGVPHCVSCVATLVDEEKKETGENVKMFVTKRTVSEIKDYIEKEKRRRVN